MTGTIDVLRAIAEGRGPERWIAALGYAGWGEGQLDEEMTRHGWFAANGDADDPVRHADRRALGRRVQGRRHRPAPAGERDRRGLTDSDRLVPRWAWMAKAEETFEDQGKIPACRAVASWRSWLLAALLIAGLVAAVMHWGDVKKFAALMTTANPVWLIVAGASPARDLFRPVRAMVADASPRPLPDSRIATCSA